MQRKLSRTFEEIDGCFRQHCSDIQGLEGVVQQFERLIRWSENLHQRATSEISEPEVIETSNAATAERTSTYLSTSSVGQSQGKAEYQSEFAGVLTENAAIQLEPSRQEWLPERDDRGWETVRQNLVTEYKIPDWLLQELNQQGWIYSDQKKRAVFVERTLNDQNYHGLTLSEEGYLDPTEPTVKCHAASSFWMATHEPLEQAIVLDDPLEVLAIHGMNTTGSKNTATLYIAAMRVDQLPIDLLRDIPQVRVSTSCTDEVKQAMEKNVPHRTMIAPNHVESWRGVWKDWSNQKQIQPKESKTATPTDMQI